MNRRNSMLALLVCVLSGATSAVAGCPSTPPITIKSQSGDQKVDAAWLERNLSSRRVIFGYGGRETYKSDGSYTYQDANGKFNAPSYRFYEDGTRCIDYSNGPRFDRYVVRNNTLVLINAGGERYETKIGK